ncbi:GNAT family N-acetyltransferase [Gracilibacillus caseinilyticus]|uniref:GNAT family N-acetyltransferase n=1 Tax=Gracilibacillus caseinilyticus TaxID=2932256 RepID=A0ABY4EZ66_9BACI|nr:GNAT family N-acetyltransferase [Gracilibacillus caseinilyticus]UOQ49250.1 GNAT family N-acetyltransferase [Gracilibacillus caseinilyticus]
MGIYYTSDIDKITEQELQELFLSVEWKSGNFPNELLKTIKGSHSVVTAWDNNKLIGLINALSDGALTAYFHYMLINPAYQGKGIGKEMMNMMLDRYSNYETKVQIAYPNVVEFYGKLGFKKEDGTTPMFISELI